LFNPFIIIIFSFIWLSGSSYCAVLFWNELWILPINSPGIQFYFLWRSSLLVFNVQV
jgi:hypothetical protein